MKTVKMMISETLRIPGAKRIFSSFGLMLLALLMLNAVRGQELAGRPDRGTSGKGTQASSQIDNINLQNGNVSMQIPLASLPPIAGGKLSYTLNAYYNSSLWNTYRKATVGEQNQNGCDSIYTSETISLAENGGWRIGGKYEIYFRDAHDDFDYLPPSSTLCDGYEYGAMQGRFFKPVLKMPDGSEHEMRIENANYPVYGGNREHLLNYYKVQGSGPYPFDGQIRLYTVDGTYITATFEASGDYTIYLKDGTQVQPATGGGQRIKDMNGNSILITASSAKDEQTGREIKWTQTTYGEDNAPATKVEYQSTGGTWQSVWVVWGKTTVGQGILYKTKMWDINATPPHTTCDKDQPFTAQEIDVVRQIILPATEQSVPPQKYVFEYNSDTTTSVTTQNVKFSCGSGSPSPISHTRDVTGMGEISRITTPTGAEMKYYYLDNYLQSPGLILSTNLTLKNVIIKKEVVHDGTIDTWNYDVPFGAVSEYSKMTAPDGSVYEETYYPTDTLRTIRAGTVGLGGLTYRTIQSGRVMTEKHWTLLGGTNLVPYGSGGVGNRVTYNAVVDTEYVSILDENGDRVKMSAKKYEYDYNGELTKTTEYDWLNLNNVNYDSLELPTGVPVGTAVLRTVNNAYYNPAWDAASTNAYHKRALGTSPMILGALKETTIGSSITHLSYDGQTYGTAPTKGNLTQTSLWDNINNQWISSSTAYSPRGNPTLQTDAKGNQTQITYGAINGYSDLYPTQTIAAYGTSIARTSTAEYDFYTGLVTSATDVDNNLTTATEYDILGRPTKTKAAVGTPLEVWTQTEYGDSARRVIARSDLFTKGDGKKIAVQHFDQLGRVRLSRQIENAATEDPYNEEHGIKVEMRYLTGNPISYQLTSNPYRAATSAAASGEPSMGWTQSKTVNTGKYSEVETFEGAALPAAFGGGNTNSTGVVRTDIDVDRTLVTDQAGKKRISRTNALGQLTDVWEITAADANTEAISFGGSTLNGYKTSYEYDTLNNLTKVSQGSQTNRTFAYNSLSRLTSAFNPESGTIDYLYDNNGNLTQKIDDRPVTTTYTYDELNRVKTRYYSDGITPQVTYTYDNKGRLTKVSNANSTTEYTAFDILGRVTKSKQTTDGTTYPEMEYTYNLSGALVEQKYPSGRIVKNVINNNGELEMVQSKKTAAHGFFSYAKNFTYTASGAVSSMQLGNGKWESTVFNSRLQPTQIALGTTQNGTDKLKLNFDYGTSQNNGNVQSQTITVPTTGQANGFTAVQNYVYDSLNRLTQAAEQLTPTGGTQVTSWVQTFDYDRYGNRRFNEQWTTASPNFPKNCGTAPNNTVCPNDVPIYNPEIVTAKNQLVGYTYDAAGNITKDAQSRKFTYDGENKQTKVETLDSNDNVIAINGEYSYDGDGKRVKKYIPSTGETTIFVYNVSGQLVAEYSTQISQIPQVSYLTSDHLGSPRINTDANGNILARHDYQTFGEEITSTQTAQRNVNLHYAGDDVRQKFTSYERDTETDLDFGQARYYSSKLGRFFSVDPENAGADESDPQSWNGYAYVRNNPTILVDPDGLDYRVCYSWGECYNYSDKGFGDYTNSLPHDFTVRGSQRNGTIIDPDGRIIAKYTYFSRTEPLGKGPGLLEKILGGGILGGGAAAAAGAGAGIGAGGGIASGIAAGAGGGNSGNPPAHIGPIKFDLTLKALRHIARRHRWNTRENRVGRFLKNTTKWDLIKYMDEAIRKGNSSPDRFGRTRYVYDFGKVIGVDEKGNYVTKIRVVVESNGDIVTAFPVLNK